MGIKKIYIFTIITILFLYWFYWALRMRNFWRFIIVVGKMGSGKTTYLTKDAIKYKNRKQLIWDDTSTNKIWKWRKVPLKIYSNSEIKGIDYEHFNPIKLGVSWEPEPYSVLFIDEASIFWSNRKFKSIDEKTLNYMKQLRKHRVRLYLYSQNFNVDKVMRDLCQEMWLVQPFMITWSIARKILKAPTIKESALDCDSQLVDNIKFAPFWIHGNLRIIWIPKYIKKFNTYQKHTAENN